MAKSGTITKTIIDTGMGEYIVAIASKAGAIGIRQVTTYGGKPVETPRTVLFKVGDQAISGSYNLIYLDFIVKISEKNVTFGKDPKVYGPNAPKKRMKLAEFVWQNANFNRAEIDKSNAETMQCI